MAAAKKVHLGGKEVSKPSKMMLKLKLDGLRKLRGIMVRKATTGGNWWDKLGKPQYGGEMVIRADRNIVNFDPYFSLNLTTINSAWMERLFADDWTLDPAVWDYNVSVRPTQYVKGQLAETWEFPDPSTCLVHLRKGVHWQDIPPANGREFIADDVVFHYNRLYGLSSDFTKPSTFRAGVTWFKDLISVTATDKYTVVFKWKTPNPEFIMDALRPPNPQRVFEAREAVEKWGDLSDWHHAIGTGPFILKDFVDGSSAMLVKNPNYWGYDERHPQNKLPYVDTVKYLIIPDDATALEAIRGGKIDIIPQISSVHAQAIQKTNPEILQMPHGPPTFSIQPRNDKAPFNDIRVRKAMQMALDLPTIAKDYYYNTVEPYPSSMTSRYMKGWGFLYEEWPQDLKDEYAYNPTAAKKLLAEAGYPNGFKTNIVADTTGNMEMLQIVKSYFAQVSLDMEIQPMESADWVAFVETNHKHDQLIYQPPGPLGLCCAPLRQFNRFQTGSSTNLQMISDPVFDGLCAKAMVSPSLDGVLRILRDANEYVARQHFAISLLQPRTYSLCQPWLKGFNAQFASTWTPASGPGMLSFYLGRFWIDQNLKKSLGQQ